MRCRHLVIVLIGTSLHGAQALDRRPALAIRPSSRPHEILRGGAGNKQPVAPPLVQGRVKTIRRCIMTLNVLLRLMLLGILVSVTIAMPRSFGMVGLLALAWSTAMVAPRLLRDFDFVGKRLIRAWRPREFDQACLEMSQKPQRMLD